MVIIRFCNVLQSGSLWTWEKTIVISNVLKRNFFNLAKPAPHGRRQGKRKRKDLIYKLLLRRLRQTWMERRESDFRALSVPRISRYRKGEGGPIKVLWAEEGRFAIIDEMPSTLVWWPCAKVKVNIWGPDRRGTYFPSGKWASSRTVGRTSLANGFP